MPLSGYFLVVRLNTPVITIATPLQGAVVAVGTTQVTGTVTDDGVVATVTVNGIAATLNGNSFTAQMPLTGGNQTIQAMENGIP